MYKLPRLSVSYLIGVKTSLRTVGLQEDFDVVNEDQLIQQLLLTSETPSSML